MAKTLWSGIEHDIIDQYLNDQNPRPWVIAFSGGKDSTTLLQVVWNSISTIDPEQRTRKLHVVCNNTLVENPVIISYVKSQLDSIRAAAVEQSMPISVEHTIPSMNNTFWVNLIGRGYVAPNSLFRWCTERLKINPTSKYIQDKVSLYGEVIILLGTRKAESNTRSRSIKRYEVKGKRLSKHDLPGANVYAPLKDVSTNDVWWYLAQNPSPWHSDNNDLVHIYRNASDDNDCPLITDKSTPACGQSRFGCWVCTVVSSDKSMMNLISSGDNWMQPLLDFRNMLAQTINRDRIDYDPLIYRMPERRNGQEGLGPYWPRWRHKILRQLLETQNIVQRTEPNIQLISEQELVAIQVIWGRDFITDYTVTEAYNEVYGTRIESLNFLESKNKENEILKSVCVTNPSDADLITNLLNAQKSKILLVNKRGLRKEIEYLIEEHIEPTKSHAYRKDNNK